MKHDSKHVEAALSVLKNLRKLGLKPDAQGRFKKSEIEKALASWEPSAEDLFDYASNVSALYDLLQSVRDRRTAEEAADEIIKDYNEQQKKYEKRIFKGNPSDLADFILDF